MASSFIDGRCCYKGIGKSSFPTFFQLALGIGRKVRYFAGMKANADVVEIPTSILDSVDTLDELEDWLMANNRRVMRELRQARQDDLAGRFKAWKPRQLSGNGRPK
jgi:molybdopterin converting factor small subunit